MTATSGTRALPCMLFSAAVHAVGSTRPWRVPWCSAGYSTVLCLAMVQHMQLQEAAALTQTLPLSATCHNACHVRQSACGALRRAHTASGSRWPKRLRRACHRAASTLARPWVECGLRKRWLQLAPALRGASGTSGLRPRGGYARGVHSMVELGSANGIRCTLVQLRSTAGTRCNGSSLVARI